MEANEEARRTKEHLQQPPASMSDTYMNNVHPSCGTDNEPVDLVQSRPFSTPILGILVGVHQKKKNTQHRTTDPLNFLQHLTVAELFSDCTAPFWSARIICPQ